MLYTIGEIIAFLLVTGIIGFFIGWLFRGLSLRSQVEERFEREVAGRQIRINTLEEEILGEREAAAQAMQQVDDAERRLAEQQDLTVTLEARLGEAEAATGDLNAKVQALQAELDGDDTTVASLRAEIERLESELREQQHLAKELADAQAGAGQTSADADERLAQLEKELVARDGQIAKLEKLVAAAGAAQDDAAASHQEAVDAHANISILEADLKAARARIAELEATPVPPVDTTALENQISGLRGAVDERGARIAELEANIAALRAERDSHQAEAATEAAPAADDDRMAAVIARTSGGEPVADDDLKRVHGIGPKIENLLKEMGITSFLQISRLTEEDVTVVNERLGGFRDRMYRDDWMSSAAELHREEHGGNG